MDGRLFIRAGLCQALVAGTIFLALVISPLDREFFRDWGAVVGPLAWIVAAAVTWRALRLPFARTALAAVLGGLASGVASVAGLHGAGLVIGVMGFAAVCSVEVFGRRDVDPDNANVTALPPCTAPSPPAARSSDG